jgi:ribonuclease HI
MSSKSFGKISQHNEGNQKKVNVNTSKSILSILSEDFPDQYTDEVLSSQPCDSNRNGVTAPTKKFSRLLFEDIYNQDYWIGMYNNSDHWTCLYCGEKFLIKAFLKSHAGEHRDEKNFSLSQTCQECHRYFESFSAYSLHMLQTGHMSDPVSLRSTPRPGSSQVPVSRTAPPHLETARLSKSQNSHISSLASSRSAFSQPYIMYTLVFGGATKPDAVIGGSSYIITDDSGALLAEGATPIQQLISSPIRLEYEGLLLGLQACVAHRIKRLRIKTSSEMILSHLTPAGPQGRSPYFRTVYHMVEDLHTAAGQILNQLDQVEFEYMPQEADLITRVYRMAKYVTQVDPDLYTSGKKQTDLDMSGLTAPLSPFSSASHVASYSGSPSRSHYSVVSRSQPTSGSSLIRVSNEHLYN